MVSFGHFIDKQVVKRYDMFCNQQVTNLNSVAFTI